MDIERALGTRYTIDTVIALAAPLSAGAFRLADGQRRAERSSTAGSAGGDRRAPAHRGRMRPGTTLAPLNAKLAHRFRGRITTSTSGFAHRRPPALIVLDGPRNPASATAIRGRRAAERGLGGRTAHMLDCPSNLRSAATSSRHNQDRMARRPRSFGNVSGEPILTRKTEAAAKAAAQAAAAQEAAARRLPRSQKGRCQKGCLQKSRHQEARPEKGRLHQGESRQSRRAGSGAAGRASSNRWTTTRPRTSSPSIWPAAPR